jgi:adenylylsulfate kinase
MSNVVFTVSSEKVFVMPSNIVLHYPTIKRKHRKAKNRHRSMVLWFTGLLVYWFTGLSGSGKSTLAHAVEEALHKRCFQTFVLDGDNVRHGLCDDLGFSVKDRQENIRRVGEVAKLFMDAGVIVLVSLISPYRIDRDIVRNKIGSNFIEIYCNASIEICEARDIKGIYKKARAGEIAKFTGVTAPYQAPLNPELNLNTGIEPLQDCTQKVVQEILNRNILIN